MAHAQMTVRPPTIDQNGVKYYPVMSAYQGLEEQIVRVLEPTSPAPGKSRKLVYLLPVISGTTTLSSNWGDGLEELRLLDIPNRLNVTVIAPSLNYEPWYGDNILDATKRMESFVKNKLVPFGDTFADGATSPARYLVGFSKSGNGAIFLLLRHPEIFKAAAAWDSPAQLRTLTTFPGLTLNFGTQENYDSYNIPILVSQTGDSFRLRNRIWISGDQSAWTVQMVQLHDQLVTASVPHTWVSGSTRNHGWNSGWLESAVTDLDANDPLNLPDTLPPVRTGGRPTGVLVAGTTQANVSLVTDESGTCRYAMSPGVAYGAMPGVCVFRPR